jgi:hypothetical protein
VDVGSEILLGHRATAPLAELPFRAAATASSRARAIRAALPAPPGTVSNSTRPLLASAPACTTPLMSARLISSPSAA